MNHPTSRLVPRLTGLAASAGIVLLVVGTPVVLFAIGAGPPMNPDWSGLRQMLTSPDDGTLALKVLALVAWLAWLVMTVSLLVETLARLRRVQVPRLPGLGIPQLAAGRLVATAALLFVALPVATQTLTAAPTHAAEFPRALVPEQLVVTAPAVPASSPLVASSASTTKREEPATVDYTVRRGDSLWKIANTQLGDGKRFVEIVDLNRDVLNGKPDFITAGTVLRLPSEGVIEPHAPATDETYTVKPGDTLSDIALDQLGDPTRYPEIVEASRNTAQPDGAHLTDPDLIRPGWELAIPGQATPDEPEVVEPQPEPSEDVAPPVDPTPTVGPATEATPVPVEEPAAAPAVADTEDGDLDETTPAWLLAGLTGAGAMLAGALFLALRSYRRTQLRYRRPGQVIAPPPPELAAVEKTARGTGAPMAERMEDLDRLMRHLASQVDLIGRPLPDLLAVELADDAVTLHLASPSPPPPGWIGSSTEWTIALTESTPEADQLAPYPLLATIGQSDDGHLWLANFEALGSVTLTGSLTAAEALGRYVAAELTLDPWAVLVDVDTLGLGDELGDLDPMRLHHHTDRDTEFLARLANELSARNGVEPEEFHALLTSAAARPSEAVQRVVRIISSRDSRTGAAVIAVGGAPSAGDVVFQLTDRRLLVPSLGLDLVAAGLSADEAAASAAIVELTRDAEPRSAPANEPAAEGWRGLTDQSGALHYALADARPPGRAGGASLLPEAPQMYEAVAATTAADIEALAPIVPEHSRRLVEDSDPSLDDDVSAWFDSNCSLPRLSVLGPVRVRTLGDASAVAKRKPHYVELLTFLALHPNGVSSVQVSEAFSLKKERVRIDIGVVRKWLGSNLRTGQPHLPSAAQSRAADEVGAWTYQVDDVLVDADLFRRLHARGQARGAAGQADYDAALHLVSGQPFGDLRDKGWSWLLDDDSRLDETLACAIVDVAHAVVIDALAKGELDRARSAADIARDASPYDEVARLDLVAVLVAEGHHSAAQQLLTDDICNRSDDRLGPIDLADRTAQIIDQHGWLQSTLRPKP